MFPPEQPTPDFPYELSKLIGEGAMGKVYLATEPALQRQVAIKVLDQEMLARLSPDASKEIISRFMQEARAAAQLSHPGITTIYSVGLSQDQPYIVMEWLEGKTLEDALEEKGHFDPVDAVKVAIGVLEALERAHQQGIIHRDIKPANLFMLSDGRVKIMDFGIAHMEQSDLVKTRANSILGTPLYAAPEQLMGEPADRRSDIYAVGVVLYELLTGETPFDGRNVVELIHHIRSKTPQRPRVFNPDVHVGLDEVVMRTLSQEPEARCQSCRALIALLLPYLERPRAQSLEFQLSEPIVVVEANASNDRVVRIKHKEMQKGHNLKFLAETLGAWSQPEPFGEQSTRDLLAKLLERPLHAEAFAGCVRFGGSHYFLLYDGLVYAAFELEQGTTGDLAYESLPERATAALLPVPKGWDPSVILLLASLTHPAKSKYQALGTDFTNLEMMIDRMCQENFSGVVRLRRKEEMADLFFWQGQHSLSVLNHLWHAKGVDWKSLCSQEGVVADVEECRTILPAFAYRHELRGFLFDVAAQGSDGVVSDTGKLEHALSLKPLGYSKDHQDRAVRGNTTTRHIYRSDPVFSCLCWMLTGMPEFFQERERAKYWKYLSGWVDLIAHVRMHDELERPQDRHTDFFDMITTDKKGKVLHLVDHRHRVTPEVLNAFVAKVCQAKEARIKTGDVGGAVLVAREFEPAVFDAYKEHVKEPEQKSFLYNIQNSFNKYEGFVRIGPTRGFHLLLVRESEHGFEPLLVS